MAKFDPKGGIERSGGITIYVYFSNFREARACLQLLQRKALINENTHLTDTSTINKIINKTINEAIPNEKRKSFVEQLQNEHRDLFISPEKFGWLKDNPRICFWLWLRLKNQDCDRYNPPQIPYPIQTPHFPTNHEERLSAIQESFDLAPIDTPDKIFEMDKLKRLWAGLHIPNKDLRWLNPTDKNQAEWAWEYTSKSHPYPQLPTPSNDKEVYQASIVKLDSSFRSREEAQLYLIKMKKAWSQKKFRMKQQDKKAYSFLLRPGTRGLLNKLSSKQHLKANEALERMIEMAYDNQLTHLEPEEKTAEITRLQMELSKMEVKLKEQEEQIESLENQSSQLDRSIWPTKDHSVSR